MALFVFFLPFFVAFVPFVSGRLVAATLRQVSRFTHHASIHVNGYFPYS